MASYSIFLIPPMLYVWFLILRDFFKYLRYRTVVKEQKIAFNALQYKTPIFELEYRRPLEQWFLAIFVLVLCIFAFLEADHFVRDDMHKSFFFLNKEQTYLLHFIAWKFVYMTLVLWFGLICSRIYFIEKVSFFSTFVVLENSLIGKTILELDNHIRLNKNRDNSYFTLYSELSMVHIRIFDNNAMNNLSSRQQKLLDEFINKIPKKKKEFII